MSAFMDRFRRNPYSNMRALAENDILELTGSGAPTNGTSGTAVGIAGPGASYFDYTNKNLYINIGTKASPYWFQTSPGAGDLFVVRTRSTIVQVNAGATLLAAIPGWKYRVYDMIMISIGGAAAAVTTVDILGTQAASPVKLGAGAQASLTQSTLLRAGSAGLAVLADGASFAVNDVNTGITIGKTGASVTTATNIDTIITYGIEQ